MPYTTLFRSTSLVHTVTLSNASSSQTSFAYTQGGGSATGGGVDYSTPPTFSNGVTLVGGNLIVPAGVVSFTITTPTTADTIDEGASENYNLTVGGVAATGSRITAATVSGPSKQMRSSIASARIIGSRSSGCR